MIAASADRDREEDQDRQVFGEIACIASVRPLEAQGPAAQTAAGVSRGGR